MTRKLQGKMWVTVLALFAVLFVSVVSVPGVSSAVYADTKRLPPLPRIPPPPRLKKEFTGVHGKVETSKTANRPWRKKGDYAPYRRGGLVFVRKTAKVEDFVRVYAKGKGSKSGSWLVKAADIRGLTPRQIREKLALIHVPTHFVHARVAKNATISRGAVAGKDNEKFGRRAGGLTQYHVSDGRISFAKKEWEIGARFSK